MYQAVNLIVFATLICLSLQLHLPDGFIKCRRSNEDFNECLKAAIQDALPKLKKGLPEFKIPSMDPLEADKLTIGEGATGAVRVVQHYTDVKTYNFSNTKIDKVESVITPKEFSLDIYGTIPEFRLEAEYEYNGQVLVLPLVGKGQIKTIATNAGVHASIKGESYNKKGKTYGKITSVALDLQLVNLHLDLQNLFNGDERLGAAMNNLINENWKEIWEDVEPGYETAYATFLQRHITRLFDKVPLDEIFPL